MALIAVVADKGAPGVSLTALAMALGWPGEVLLAECDPAGSDLPWRMRSAGGQPLSSTSGILTLASSLRSTLPTTPTTPTSPLRVWDHVQQLDGGLPVLVGPSGPEQAEAVGRGWSQVATVLAGLGEADVVADCGRFLTSGSPAAPVLRAADLVVLVTRPCLAGVAHLRHGVEVVARVLNAGDSAGPVTRPGGRSGRGSGLGRIGVVVVDDGTSSGSSGGRRADRRARGWGRRAGVRSGAGVRGGAGGEVGQVLADAPGLSEVPVLGVIDWDPRAAAALTGRGWGRGLSRSALLRTAAVTAQVVHDQVHGAGHDRPAEAGVDQLHAAHALVTGLATGPSASVSASRAAPAKDGQGPSWTWSGPASAAAGGVRATAGADGPDSGIAGGLGGPGVEPAGGRS